MISHWLIAIRPKTLSLSLVPVVLGNVLGWMNAGMLSWPVMVATLLAALFIQIGTNLHNDAADFEHGADLSPTRLGPPRATAEGWLSASEVRRGATLSFVLAMLAGSYLVWVGGWPILVVGLTSIAAGLAYTGGPKPIAYVGLGELFVFVFFGLAAVAGSYYLQTGGLSWQSLVIGAMIGFLAAAVLVVNNYRDMENDRLAGKHTLAVRFGRRASQIEYTALMLGPFMLLPLLHSIPINSWWLAIPLISTPWALYLVMRFRNETPGRVFNQLLAATAQFQLGFGLLLCLSLLGGHEPSLRF
jgi:1,4-dihydroxy-2-naphthoate octaprenyltransferase